MTRWIVAMLLAGAAQAQGWQPYSPALLAAANAGDPAAQTAIGEAYRTGNGVQAERELAIAWFRKAAARDTRAADALGVLLFVKGERKQAVPLLQAASQRGSAQALYILGTARFNGDYVPRDVGAAYAEMRLAAQKGLPEATRSLQLMEPYVSAADRARADALAAQPMGPETGALPVPPVGRTVVASVAPVAAPPVTTSSTAASQPAPLATIALPPSRPATQPSIAQTPAIAAPTSTPPVTTPAMLPPRPRPPVKAASPGGGWRVQLAAVGSAAAAESEWKRLSFKVPALAGLGHEAVPAGAMIRLQATGIVSRAEAAALCQKLVAAGLGCFVVAPSP